MIRSSASNGNGSPDVTGFYEPDTGSIQYVVSDPATKKAALVDVVWNFDDRSASTSTKSADEILDFVAAENLDVEWILDTHPHADHFSAAAYLKDKLGAPTAIGEKVKEIAVLWRGFYNEPDAFDVDACFDRLFADGDEFTVGTLPVKVMLSPGHTLGSITYVVGSDAAFVHDTLMYPDSGTSRADFPGGSASELWETLQNILALPGETRIFIERVLSNLWMYRERLGEPAPSLDSLAAGERPIYIAVEGANGSVAEDVRN